MKTKSKHPALMAILAVLGWVALFLGIQLVAGLVYGTILSAQYMAAQGDFAALDLDAMQQTLTQQALDATIPLLVVCYVCLLAVIFIIFLLRRRNIAKECCWKGAPLSRFGLPVGAAFGLYAGVNIGLLVAPLPESWTQSLEQYSSGLESSGLGMYLFAVVLLTPLVEETLFRGLVYSRLRRAFPAVVSILLSAAVFGLIHFTGSWMLVLPAFLMGVVCAISLEKTGSIWPGVAAHLAANFTAVVQTLCADQAAMVQSVLAIACLILGVVCFVLLLRQKPLSCAAALLADPGAAPRKRQPTADVLPSAVGTPPVSSAEPDATTDSTNPTT